jgi:hypothetical protein
VWNQFYTCGILVAYSSDHESIISLIVMPHSLVKKFAEGCDATYSGKSLLSACFLLAFLYTLILKMQSETYVTSARLHACHQIPEDGILQIFLEFYM